MKITGADLFSCPQTKCTGFLEITEINFNDYCGTMSIYGNCPICKQTFRLINHKNDFYSRVSVDTVHIPDRPELYTHGLEHRHMREENRNCRFYNPNKQ